MNIYKYLEGCIVNWVSHELLLFEYTNKQIEEAEEAGWLIRLDDDGTLGVALGENIYYIRTAHERQVLCSG